MKNKKIYILMVCLAVVLTGCGLNLRKKVNEPEVKKEPVADNVATSAEKVATSSLASSTAKITAYVPEKIPADFMGIEDISSVKEYLKNNQIKKINTDLEETKDWSVYRNEETGVEFRYPQEYLIEEQNSGYAFNTHTYFKNDKYITFHFSPWIVEDFSRIDWSKFERKFSPTGMLESWEELEKIGKKETCSIVKINTHEAMRFFTYDIDPTAEVPFKAGDFSSVTTYYFFIVKSGRQVIKYSFQFFNGIDDNKGKIKDVSKSILGTVKFLK